MDHIPFDSSTLPNFGGITSPDSRHDTVRNPIKDAEGNAWRFFIPEKVVQVLWYETALKQWDWFSMGYRNSREIITWLFDLYRRSSGQNLSEKDRRNIETEIRAFIGQDRRAIKIEDALQFLERLNKQYHIQWSHELALRILGFSQMDIGLYLRENEERILREWVRIEAFFRSLSENKDIIEILRNLYEKQWVGIIWWVPSGITSSISTLREGNLREQRLRAQDLLAKFVDIIREKTWVSIGAVSFWGREHGDGGAIFRIPNKWEKWDTFLILSKERMSIGSLEDALDSYSLGVKRPVFAHYSGDAHADPHTPIETPMSRWMREQLFWDEKTMKEWMQYVPQGKSVWISFLNTGKEVILTSMSKDGWFVRARISEKDFYGIVSSTQSVSVRKRWAHFLAYATWSTMSFSDPGYKTQKALQTWMELKGMLFKNWDTSVEWNISWVLSAQTNAWEYTNIQIAEWKFWTGLTGTHRLSEKTTLWLSFERDGLWAPNATPNTLYKLPLSERNIFNSLIVYKTWARVEHIMTSGEVVTLKALHENSSFHQKLWGSLSYKNGTNYIFLSGEKNIGTDDFSPSNREVTLWIWWEYQGMGWGIKWTEQRRGEKNPKIIGASITIPLGK